MSPASRDLPAAAATLVVVLMDLAVGLAGWWVLAQPHAWSVLGWTLIVPAVLSVGFMLLAWLVIGAHAAVRHAHGDRGER